MKNNIEKKIGAPGLFHSIPPVCSVLLKSLNFRQASIPAFSSASSPSHLHSANTSPHHASVCRGRSLRSQNKLTYCTNNAFYL